MADEVGGYFTLLDVEIRSGGFGVVRKGIDRRDGTFVAVKFITGKSDELSRKVFERERRGLQDLSHPHIVPFRSSGIDDSGTYFIVLDWVDKNLDEVLDENGPWQSWDQLCKDIALPLIDALAYAHLKQVEHRDIKPKNVLISASGAPMLADFGIAKIRGDDEETTNTVADWHSPPYAPPELNADVRYVRDVWSIGVLLLQCLSTERLKSFADVDKAVEAVNVPPEIRRLLTACVANDPADRPRNASDLLASLVAAQKRRVGQAAQASATPIWLRLGNKAIASLAGTGDSREAQAIVRADLSGDVFASYVPDPESGEPKRDAIFLVGDGWRYHLIPDADGAFVAAARQLELEALERLRQRSLLLPKRFAWSFTRSPGSDGAIGQLQDALDDFASEKAESIAAGVVEREGDDLFDTWLRILAAREQLARGERKDLHYRQFRVKGREATFTLTETLEQDLVGTEWRAKDSHTERRFGWGEVVDQDGDRLTLLGNRWTGMPDRGLLVAHIGPDEVAIGRQRDAVIAVKNGASARQELRELLLRPEDSSAPQPVEIDAWGRDLDDRKQEAVSKALGADDIFLVQGPPGTGKTSFIAELVDQTLRAKPDARVLIASQTNVAVDNALEKLDEGDIGNLVRLTSKDPTRVSEAVRHLMLDSQMKRWAQSVRKKAEAHLAGKAEAAGISNSHLRAALALQQLAATVSELDQVQSRAVAEEEAPEATELSTALGSSELTATAQERVEQLSDLRDELFGEAQAHLGSDLTLSLKMTPKEFLNAVDVLVGEGEEAKTLLTHLRLQGQWLQRIATDERLEATFLDRSSVIAGTCTGFLRHPAVRHLDIDLCIVDEASRATLTEALVPVSRATKWVFVGDTNQLPPTDEEMLRNTELLSEHQLTAEDIKETLFQRLADNLPEHCQEMLTQQYRMVRAIGDLISTCFYEENLTSKREDGIEGYEVGYGKPVMWVDTSSLGNARRESAPQGGATSYANRAEVRVVFDRLKILNKSIELNMIHPPKANKPLEVLVIAPYLSQVTGLKAELARQRASLNHLDIAVMSVDAVQGRESDVALLSLTRSNPGGHLGFLGADYWRRINVALSRAKYGLTIVGDAGFIKGTSGSLKRVLEYVESHPADCEIRMAER